jgi:hypothetical protein
MSDHEYKPLAERYIRLLQLPEAAEHGEEPALVDVPLDASPPYETISYVWGEQDKPYDFEFGSGRSVNITPTLRTTLA